jgi:hypothetical protein
MNNSTSPDISFWSDCFYLNKNNKYCIVKNADDRVSVLERSINNGKKFIEYFDRNKLAFYLINEAEIKQSINRVGRDKDILYSYYCNSRLNQLEVFYKQSNKKMGGRMQAVKAISGQGMLREVRHTIFGVYTDLDVVNCHPVLLKYICINVGVKPEFYKCLDRYINHRDEVFNEILLANSDNDSIISKDYIKMCFLSILNGGEKAYKELKNKTEFITSFKQEVSKISKLLSNLFVELYVEVRNKKRSDGSDFNLSGSFLSRLLQFMENKLLMNIFIYLKDDLNLTDMMFHSILSFDGIMIKSKIWKPEFKEKIEKYLAEIMGYEVKLSIKDFKPLDLSKFGYEEEVNYSDVLDSAEYCGDEQILLTRPELHKDRINRFTEEEYYWGDFERDVTERVFRNKKHAVEYIAKLYYKVCASDGRCYVLKDSKEVMYDIWTYEALKRLQRKVRYYVFSKKASGVSKRLVVENLFDFTMYYDSIFDRFKRFEFDFVEKLDDGRVFYAFMNYRATIISLDSWNLNKISYCEDVQFFLQFIKEIYCNGDENAYNYLMKWLAFIIKYPYMKSRISLFLTGKQGTGKSFFAEWLANFIFGKYISNTNISGLSGLTKENNFHLLGKKFLVINELSAKKDNYHETFDKLKSFTTEDTITIKKLYADPIVSRQTWELVFISNHINSIKIEESDRRYFCLSVSEKYLDDKPFFSSLSARISNMDFANKFASYLYHEAGVDSPEAFTTLKMYETEAKRVMKYLSKSSVSSFVEFMKNDNLEYNNNYKQSPGTELDSDYILSKDKDKYCFKSSELYEFYKHYCCMNGFKTVNQKIFKVEVEYCGVIVKRTKDGIIYYFGELQ